MCKVRQNSRRPTSKRYELYVKRLNQGPDDAVFWGKVPDFGVVTFHVREKMGVEIKFPIIAGLDMKVAGLYGMVHPGQSTTAAVRTVFFIDPDGILRGMLYYPLSNGRNVQEILRLLRAFQTGDEHHVATPALSLL